LDSSRGFPSAGPASAPGRRHPLRPAALLLPAGEGRDEGESHLPPAANPLPQTHQPATPNPITP
jgi:hypothetical protein